MTILATEETLQTYSEDGTRQERTGWRDRELSLRHRVWGFNCPMADLDFLAVEYNLAKPVGLVEYKHYRARVPDLEQANYRALIDLADNYKCRGLPFLVAIYWPKIWAFRVMPGNAKALEHFKPGEELCEFDFVAKLYRMRQFAIVRDIADKLNRFPVPEEG